MSLKLIPFLAPSFNLPGAFVIPYIIMIFLVGVPIILMETTIGQFTAMGPVHAYANLAPLFQGIGVTAICISGFIGIYYNVILAWTLVYLIEPFRGERWKTCNNAWNNPGRLRHPVAVST